MADRVRVLNHTRSTVLAERGRRAVSAWQRFRGLMLTDALPEGEALVLEPCNSIHMFFMRYPIDVIFVSGQPRPAGDGERAGTHDVVGLVPGIRPWRMTRFYRGARLAIELPVGAIERSGTQQGDQLALEPVGPA